MWAQLMGRGLSGSSWHGNNGRVFKHNQLSVSKYHVHNIIRGAWATKRRQTNQGTILNLANYHKLKTYINDIMRYALGHTQNEQNASHLRRASSLLCSKISRDPILNQDFAKRKTIATEIKEHVKYVR